MPYSTLPTSVYPLTTGTAATVVQTVTTIDPVTLTTPVPFVESYSSITGTVTGTSLGTTPTTVFAVSTNPAIPTTSYIVQVTPVADTANFNLSIPTGTYTVTAFADGFQAASQTDVTSAAPAAITLAADTDLTTGYTAALGTITDGTNPISGAMITLTDTTTTPTIAGYTLTNAAGQYAFVGLNPANSYTVTAAAQNYQTSAATSITVTAAVNTIPDIALTAADPTLSSTVIDGVITSDGTTAVANTAVVLLATSDTTTTAIDYSKTNSAGYYCFVIPNANLATTSYNVQATNNIV